MISEMVIDISTWRLFFFARFSYLFGILIDYFIRLFGELEYAADIWILLALEENM